MISWSPISGYSTRVMLIFTSLCKFLVYLVRSAAWQRLVHLQVWCLGVELAEQRHAPFPAPQDGLYLQRHSLQHLSRLRGNAYMRDKLVAVFRVCVGGKGGWGGGGGDRGL